MIKSFAIRNDDLESNIFPNYYLFKQRIKNFSQRRDIKSFSLGDKDVLQTLTDGEHAGQKFVSNGALFIKNSSVKRYGISEFDGFYITHEKNNLLKRSKLKRDDVLFTTIGYYLGVAALVNSNVENANINQNVVRIRINPKFTSPQYLSCFLNSKLVRFQIDNLFSGTYPILTYPKIKSLKIFIKDKLTENKVTNYIIKAEEHQLKALSLIKRAQEIFIKSLNVDFSKIASSKFFAVGAESFDAERSMNPAFYYPLYINTINEIKKKNRVVQLGNVADCKNGDEVGSANYKRYLDRKETDVPFIRTTDLINYDVDLYPDFYIEKDIANSFNQDLKQGDIIYTNDGKIGLSAMLTNYDNVIIQSHLERIRCNLIDPYYLFIALSTDEVGLTQAKRYTVTQSTIPTIGNNLNEFIIPISKSEAKIIELTKEAFKLKDLRKKLITESRLLIERSLEVTT